MKRFLCRCLVAGLFTPVAGCLTANPVGTLSSAFPGMGSSDHSVKGGAPQPAETAEICLNLAVDLERNNYLADAATQLEKARRLDPNLKNIEHRLAVIYDRLGDERRALSEFEAALKNNPKDADLHNDFGYCYYNRGRWVDAESMFRRAIALNEKHERAWNNLGMALAQQGKQDPALQAFSKVCSPAEAKSNLAFVVAARGEKEEAMRLYRGALAIEPNLRSAQQALATLEGAPGTNFGVAKPAAFQRPGGNDKPQNAASAASAASIAEAKKAAMPSEPIDTSPVTVGPRRVSADR